jgi:hypothetical protein
MRLLDPPSIIFTAMTLLSAVCAQSPVNPVPRHYKAVFSGPFASIKPGISGAPYSAEQTYEFETVLRDGTRAHRVWPEWLYRDSEGRFRGERQMGDDARVRLIQIVDQVAGYQYVIDAVNKVVHRIQVTPATPVPLNRAAESIADLARMSHHNDTLNVGFLINGTPETTTEALGQHMIEGISTHGIKTTRKYSSASAGPITITTEAWVSDELKVILLSKRNDPRTGETITRMLNYSSAEPAASLFQPPPNYKVIDEEGRFAIDIVIPVIAERQ